MLSFKRTLRYFDVISFTLALSLMLIGLLFIFSATYKPASPFSLFFKKQLIGILGGTCLYLLCCAIDYRWFMQTSSTFYTGAIGLLLFTMIKGTIGMGAQRWINLFFFKIQPSELIKLLYPLSACTYLYENRRYFTHTMREFVPLITTLCISVILILKQPDLGTALIVLFSGLFVLWLAHINIRFFTYGTLILLMTAPVSWHTLKPYQKKRILVFLGQGSQDKERYQLEQSKIAIGSGGITGKGFLRGTQNKLLFLPESRTDFIFSVIAEETGLIGGLLVLIIYGFLFMRLCMQTHTIRDRATQLLAYGLIVPIFLSAAINICMVIGLLPIVGIPLPFISYGLSNLWVTCATLGIFSSIIMRSKAMAQ